MHEETSPYLLFGAQDQRLGSDKDQLPCGSTGTSGDCQETETCMVTTASPKPFFRAPRRVRDAVVGRGNAGWTTSKSGHIFPCQNCSQGPPAEKTGRGSLLNPLSCPSDDPIGQGNELNRTEQEKSPVVHERSSRDNVYVSCTQRSSEPIAAAEVTGGS